MTGKEGNRMKYKSSDSINVQKHRRNLRPYLMLVPAVFVLLMISVYPVLYGIYMSMTNKNLLRPGRNDFIFLENFIELGKDQEFLGTLGFTFVYTFSVVILSYVLGLGLALLLNRKIRFRGVFRTLFLLPWVIPSVVAVVNWKWVLNDQVGIINTVLQDWGIIESPVLFLGDYSLVRITVILISVWKQMPFMIITLLAGLQSVPEDLYEAAEMDGAGFWQTLTGITLPIIKPITFISTILTFLWTFNTFEIIWLLTGGGPTGYTFTLPILSYYTAFVRQDISYASAIAVMMIMVLLVISLIYFRLQFGKEKEE